MYPRQTGSRFRVKREPTQSQSEIAPASAFGYALLELTGSDRKASGPGERSFRRVKRAGACRRFESGWSRKAWASSAPALRHLGSEPAGSRRRLEGGRGRKVCGSRPSLPARKVSPDGSGACFESSACRQAWRSTRRPSANWKVKGPGGLRGLLSLWCLAAWGSRPQLSANNPAERRHEMTTGNYHRRWHAGCQ